MSEMKEAVLTAYPDAVYSPLRGAILAGETVDGKFLYILSDFGLAEEDAWKEVASRLAPTKPAECEHEWEWRSVMTAYCLKCPATSLTSPAPATPPQPIIEADTSEICDVCGVVLEFPDDDDPMFLGDTAVTSKCRHVIQVREVERDNPAERCVMGEPLTPTGQTWEHCFKNFHRNLCERFGYVHDEKDWFRDQASLEEYIANEMKVAAEPQSVMGQCGHMREGCDMQCTLEAEHDGLHVWGELPARAFADEEDLADNEEGSQEMPQMSSDSRCEVQSETSCVMGQCVREELPVIFHPEVIGGFVWEHVVREREAAAESELARLNLLIDGYKESNEKTHSILMDADAKIEKLESELAQLEKIIPSSYYADRPLQERLSLLVRHWNRGIVVTTELESELAVKAVQIEQLVGDVQAAVADYNDARAELAVVRKSLERYAQHSDGCSAGRAHVCVCRHSNSQHFDFESRPCAHCKCKKFKVGDCSCGLAKARTALESRKEHTDER